MTLRFIDEIIEKICGPREAKRPAPVDIAAVLDEKASKLPADQPLDWRHSIVDLMKLVGIDGRLENRRQLAHELGYPGSMDDSAEMNVWLHKQVMNELAENGGEVPSELR